MNTAERRVLAALWSLRGVGAKTIEAVRSRCGALGELVERPLAEWADAVPWSPRARASLKNVDVLGQVADGLERELRLCGYEVVFSGDAAFPRLLVGVERAPPLLFMLGPGAAAPPRRRVAMVGTRHPDAGFEREARALAGEVASIGLGIVSGAAEGVDQFCHEAALAAAGETWAFLGCAIDQVDAAQARLFAPFRTGAGTFFSEFPPGARADRSTFPRRNRLISGSADAVIVLRAPRQSGALRTAEYALGQGRPVLALPGDHFNPAAAGCNALLGAGHAAMCLGLGDILVAVGLGPELGAAQVTQAVSPGSLSALARAVLANVSREPRDYDELLAACGAEASGLGGALTELELAGLVLQRPGRRYESLG